MTRIDHIIPSARWEAIRDAILAVLLQEFTDQVYYFQNTACSGVTFWAERTTPIDKTENAIIVINTFKAAYDTKDVVSAHGLYTFVIDFMTNAKASGSGPDGSGDKAASLKMQRIMRTVRYILEHPNYNTLGLGTGAGIEHTEVASFQIYRDERANAPADAMNSAIGQIIFQVRCEETVTPNAGILAGGSDTVVMIELTDRGFQYGGYFTPPPNPDYVNIIDRETSELIYMAPGGTDYPVLRFSGIVDNGPPYTNSIVDNGPPA